MSDDTFRLVVIAMITAIPPTLAGVAALIVAMRGSQKLTALHLQINSRMDQLLAVSKTAAHAEGVASERTQHERKDSLP